MGLLNKFIKQQTKTKEIHDGYSIVTLSDSFIAELRKNLEKESNKDYKNMQNSFKKYNGVPVIPPTFNPMLTKYRMQIESAIDNEGLVGIQINETNKFYLDDEDYGYLEDSLYAAEAEYVIFNNHSNKIILCTNDKNNIKKITDIVYNEVINKRESLGIGIDKKDGFLNKELSFEEQKFLEQQILQEIVTGLYMGNEELALNLFSGDKQLIKIILQEKHKKDVEKILTYLQMEYAIIGQYILVDKQNINKINSKIDGYIHGAVIVKDRRIYGIDEREVVKKPGKEQEHTVQQDIDNIIDRHKSKDDLQHNNIKENEIYK